MAQDDPFASTGGKVSAKVAEYLSRVMATQRERLAGHYVRVAMQAQEEFFRLTGSEIRRTIAPLWATIGETPEMPMWARDTGRFIAAGQGQMSTMLAGAITGTVMGVGLGALVANELGPGIGAILAANPNMRLSPETSAAVDIRGIKWPAADLVLEAKNQGVNEDRYEALRALATSVLDPASIMMLYARGDLDRAFALRLFHRAGWDGDHAARLLTLARQHISLPDAASMWNRSIMDDDELREIARLNGYSRQDADRYAELGGEPPAPEILYTAFRRGIIDEARLHRGIVQGPIRNEWIDVIQAVQFRSMTPEQAAGAVTQGHMTLARGQGIAREYGLHAEDFATLVETAGQPPGVEFASEAFLRGFITDDEFGAMFLESRLKNRYLPLLRKMRTRLMPQETARSLLAKGVITPERCATILAQHGFEQQDIEAFLLAATSDRGSAIRDLSISVVLELYEEQEIDQPTAIDMIMSAGYDENEAGLYLQLADVRRVRTYRNAVITRVRNGFVKGFFDEQSTGTALDALSVPPARRDTLINLWTLERQTITKDLTSAQIVAAAKKGLMAPDAAVSRLIGQGYDDSDARIVLALAGVLVE